VTRGRCFSDFRQFSAEKIGVFLKDQCQEQVFALFSFALNKKPQFSPFFGENNLNIITSVPDCLYWAVVLKITEVAQTFGLLFSTVKVLN
jgi:hypothetical protein